jgi:1-deoxy-D-xylulose-5-phosphate reductoisomerase
MKTLAIIGSTGSIGSSALKVYNDNKNFFNLVCLAANSNYRKLIKQKKKYKPKDIFLFSSDYSIKNTIPTKDFFKKYEKKKIDFIISGISGL